tara:strand:- start:2018 stop:2746 length:729 start_codon:yes stop_codon:yes gene_type:complete
VNKEHLEKQISVIILATNEEKALHKTVETILNENNFYINKIFIITPKDTSKGCLKTIEKLKKIYINILIHKFQPKQLPGYGGASIFGIGLIETTHFVLCDADGETDPKEIKNLIKNIDNSKYDIISCSRWKSKNWLNEYGFLNFIFNWIFQKTTSLLFFSNLTDYTVNYRLYSSSMMKQINFKYLNQSFALESILIPLRKGCRIKEIPYNFVKRNEGISRNNFFNKLKYIKTLIECRTRKIY